MSRNRNISFSPSEESFPSAGFIPGEETLSLIYGSKTQLAAVPHTCKHLYISVVPFPGSAPSVHISSSCSPLVVFISQSLPFSLSFFFLLYLCFSNFKPVSQISVSPHTHSYSFHSAVLLLTDISTLFWELECKSVSHALKKHHTNRYIAR